MSSSLTLNLLNRFECILYSISSVLSSVRSGKGSSTYTKDREFRHSSHRSLITLDSSTSSIKTDGTPSFQSVFFYTSNRNSPDLVQTLFPSIRSIFPCTYPDLLVITSLLSLQTLQWNIKTFRQNKYTCIPVWRRYKVIHKSLIDWDNNDLHPYVTKVTRK